MSKIDKNASKRDRLMEQSFFAVLGKSYEEMLSTNFTFEGANIVEQAIQGNKVTMYQGVWRGKDRLDGVVRAFSVMKDSIDKIIKEDKECKTIKH